MRRGEKGILVAIGVVVLLFGSIKVVRNSSEEASQPDPGIPFYTTASKELIKSGSMLYRQLGCRKCHTLWGIRDPMQSVPSPPMDGIGSLKEEEWLYSYLSAENPQSIVPSRLKAEYKMPSFADIPESDRRILAAYLSHLKVEDWYLDEVKKVEYEKLTGEDYPAAEVDR